MTYLILGASGHAKEVAEVLRAIERRELPSAMVAGIDTRGGAGRPGAGGMPAAGGSPAAAPGSRDVIAGFLDDRPELQDSRVAGAPVLGVLDHLGEFAPPLVPVIGAGYPETKARMLSRIDVEQLDWHAIVHPHATIGRSVEIGRGVLIQAGAVITADTKIEEFVTVNVAATIAHDCVLRRLATISPGAHLGGNVEVGEGAFVGIGASVIQGVRIGAWSVVGAGAVVIRDVAPNTIVTGVPARSFRLREPGWWAAS